MDENNFKEYVAGYAKYINLLNEMGIEGTEAIELLKILEFREISNALEGINNNLSEIAVSLDSLEKDLDGCISVSGNSQYLCIAGDVNTY